MSAPPALASLDGNVVPLAEAVIPVTDEGLLRGDGVFEVVRLYEGRPFAWEEHLERITRSAENLRLPLDADALAADVLGLLSAAQPGDAALRCVVTRGGRRIVLLEELKVRSAPIRLASITYSPTRVLDGVKSLSYGANMLATRLAQEQGADDALLVTPHGRVLESPTCSFFYALPGQGLCTPPLGDHILDSITRRHVLAATGARERVTAADDLLAVEEAFLASTLREVHPVTAIDGRVLDAPGPRSGEAAEIVAAHIRGLLER